MASRDASTVTRHPIQVVARRTGLTPDSIRVWERRYGAVTPARTSKNRRLYTDEEVERLRLLRRATLAGRRIGDVARLSDAELGELVRADESEIVGHPTPRKTAPQGDPAEPLRSSCLEALENLNTEGVEKVVSEAVLALSKPALVNDFFVPLIETVGDRWCDGTLRVAHEHLATSMARTILGGLIGRQVVAPSAPEIIVSTPAGQRHELGGLMAAVMAAVHGWKVVYLGPDLPAEEIAVSAQRREARAVALSVVYPADDPRLVDELRRLRGLLSDDVMLFVGGRAAAAYREVLDEVGATVLTDLQQLRRELENARSSVA